MIYNRLALLRADMNMSRQELADKAGINLQTVGFIERGDYAPSLELTFKLARVFGVEITDIFSDKPFKPLFVKTKERSPRDERK